MGFIKIPRLRFILGKIMGYERPPVEISTDTIAEPRDAKLLLEQHSTATTGQSQVLSNGWNDVGAHARVDTLSEPSSQRPTLHQDIACDCSSGPGGSHPEDASGLHSGVNPPNDSPGVPRQHMEVDGGASTTLTSTDSCSTYATAPSTPDWTPRMDKVWEEGDTLTYKEHRFIIQHQIGAGSFGFVWSAIADDLQEVAIKVVSKTMLIARYVTSVGTNDEITFRNGFEDATANVIVNELNALKTVTAGGSPFLTPLLYAFSDADNFYFVMRMYPTNLLNQLRQPCVNVHPFQIRIWMAELVLAIQKLHELGFVHRDLKTENILISPNGHICLGDFGLTANASPNSSVNELRMFGRAGTEMYYAPEQRCPDDAQGPREGYTCKIDTYAIGLVFLSMWIGKNLGWDARPDGTKLINWYVKDLQAKDLIQRLLHPNPNNRPDWDAVRSHPYLATGNWQAYEQRRVNTGCIPCLHTRRMVPPMTRVAQFYKSQGHVKFWRLKHELDKMVRDKRGLGSLAIDYECPPDLLEDPLHGISCFSLGGGKCFYSQARCHPPQFPH
ncbi:kinase-like protein [Leucogyrophana mollusca]|uniref:Kinase-like protein n=1 Tax=Leucogyrophana mollusca TaxID=85980 RepID=A0ACB8BHB1_9AGAM|nr:kinase-like protein [Leucogyrophana mollusca]